jgi:hypothetical protein
MRQPEPIKDQLAWFAPAGMWVRVPDYFVLDVAVRDGVYIGAFVKFLADPTLQRYTLR